MALGQRETPPSTSESLREKGFPWNSPSAGPISTVTPAALASFVIFVVAYSVG